jgi:tricorn protease
METTLSIATPCLTPRLSLLGTALLALALAAVAGAQGLPLPEEQPARLARFPAVSPDGAHLCFTHQGNLWTAPATGGVAVRLTANDSFDSNPRWSPDGAWIAFNSDREGGSQVFLIPAVGGRARQLTHHGAATTVHDWFPDGRGLLVTSGRDTYRAAIYRLDAVSGRLSRLLEDESHCQFPSLSPDGKWLAYQRGALVDLIRKGYRGSANFDIYLAPVDGSAPPRRLTDSDRNDWWPLWSGDGRSVLYVSERDGTATLWRQSRDGGAPARVVETPPDAIRYPTIARNGSLLAYECAGRVFTAAAGSAGPGREARLLCRTDERGPRSTQAAFSNTGVTDFTLSPDGKRLAVVIRGDIFLAGTERTQEAIRLTDTPTREATPAWAPDGKTLAFTSNRDGAWRLYVADVATREARALTPGEGLVAAPAYSPDGAWIAFVRRPQSSLWVIRPDGSGEQRVAEGPKIGDFHWSPDGRWLAFEKEDDIRNWDVWAVPFAPAQGDLAAGQPVNLTDYPGFNDIPRWLADGSRLLFRSNRTRNRDVETINDEGRYALYGVPLQPEPQKFEDDPEAPTPPPAPAGGKKNPEVRLDPDEIERRARQIVAPGEGMGTYEPSPDGKLAAFVARTQGQNDLWQVGVDGTGLQRLTTSGVSATRLQWSPDGARLYYLAGGAVRWVGKGGAGSGAPAFTARMEIDRLADYRAAFDEAWQTLNDRFYDRTFRGQDWKAIGARYRELLEHVATRRDFSYLVTQMLGELNASHLGISGGTAPPRDTGYLGVWADEKHEGPGVKVESVLRRSPADRAESRIKPGEFVMAVDGLPVAWGPTWDRALAGKSGRPVTLLVNQKPAREGARVVRVRPITRSAWLDLMYERWVDGRRAAADRLSGGRLGYLHVADMGDEARNRFERELFSIGRRKEGIVLDLRFNSGGDTHDSLLRMLERNRHYFRMAPRLETPFPQPERAYTKPVVLLINEHSLSDAEAFAHGFRELKIGKTVGVPTMGWIIFTYGTTLVDGSLFRVPHLGCFTLDGRDMENWGVPPDLRVENTPADFQAGRDPQLERAVALLAR